VVVAGVAGAVAVEGAETDRVVGVIKGDRETGEEREFHVADLFETPGGVGELFEDVELGLVGRCVVGEQSGTRGFVGFADVVFCVVAAGGEFDRGGG